MSVVDVPQFNYLMIDGSGDPNTSDQYRAAVEALYALSYGIRAISKASDIVYTVMPLEGLWWFLDNPPNTPFDMTQTDKSRFQWTMMIMQPDHITADTVAQAREIVRQKKNPTSMDDLRFEVMTEGHAVQIMHIGSYNDEAPTVSKLHDHIAENGWKLDGKHHEIYLSNPERVAPEKLKTVIRQPYTTP